MSQIPTLSSSQTVLGDTFLIFERTCRCPFAFLYTINPSLPQLAFPSLVCQKPETWPKSKLASKGGREGERIKRLKGRKVFIILLFREGRQAAALEECVAKADSVEELNKLVLSRCWHPLSTHIYVKSNGVMRPLLRLGLQTSRRRMVCLPAGRRTDERWPYFVVCSYLELETLRFPTFNLYTYKFCC